MLQGFFMHMKIQELYQIYLRYPTISTDTRQISKDSIFFALKGASFNGNEFAPTALEKGAAYVVVDDPRLKEKSPSYIFVDDVLQALQELARYHRRTLGLPVLAITGSNGKTTTKELLSAVLSKKFNLLYTLGNLNNHIGVPLTLLRLTKEHEMAVVEMGANHIGEIDMLCKIAEPDYGLITNIGRAHLEGFGSPQGVIKAKSEMYRHIKAHGKAVFVNSNNDLLMALSENIESIRYGTGESNFVTGELLGADPFVKLKWKRKDGPAHDVTAQLIGAYNFENILAACAAGVYFGVDEGKICDAIESYVPSNNRSQVMKTSRNTLIMDAYNANPTSMDAAIRSFAAMDHSNKWMVLGDMLELGHDSRREHQQLVETIRKNNLENVVLIGPEFSATEHQGFRSFPTTEAAKEFVSKENLSDCLILLKGSRGMKLETLAELL